MRKILGVVLSACVAVSALAVWAQSPPNTNPNPRPQPLPNPVVNPLPPAPATTVQLPTFGVAIDAHGVLQRTAVEDPGGQLAKQRQQAAMAKLPRDVQAKSALRKVSLARLEQALVAAVANGGQPDDTLLCLAGLQRVQYVFAYPDDKDIVIAGPAEGWAPDAAGRPLGLSTGRPTLQLVDLVAALRVYPPGRARPVFVGCTIDPTEEGLGKLRQAQAKVPSSIRKEQEAAVGQQTAQALQEALGQTQIRVFGVPATTHFAAVLLEADYRMKLIGIGLETPPLRLNSYLDLVSGGSHSTLQRWWFTPHYECVRATADHLACELVGQGVQLQSENKVIGPDGQLLNAAQPNRISDLFTDGFTKKYPELAARSPVFAQLRNAIDLTIAAAWLQQEQLYDKCSYRPQAFLDEQKFAINTLHLPQVVPAAVNVVWKGSRMIALAGGGVSIRADQALSKDRLLPDDGERVRAAQQQAREKIPAGRWWWD